MLIVTMAIISLGEIIWANWELVSILSILGTMLKTFCQGSLKRLTQILKILSIIESSISEKSLPLDNGLPAPPSNLSIITKPRLEAISNTILPSNGSKSTTPRSTGLDNALENSE